MSSLEIILKWHGLVMIASLVSFESEGSMFEKKGENI
jgi:hypothetical protein